MNELLKLTRHKDATGMGQRRLLIHHCVSMQRRVRRIYAEIGTTTKAGVIADRIAEAELEAGASQSLAFAVARVCVSSTRDCGKCLAPPHFHCSSSRSPMADSSQMEVFETPDVNVDDVFSPVKEVCPGHRQ